MNNYEQRLDEIIEGILDNKDAIERLEMETQELKDEAMRILEDNFIMDYMSSDGLAKIQLMNYTKDLVNKEKVEKLLADLKTGKADVDSVKMSDTTKESRIKFVTVRVIE